MPICLLGSIFLKWGCVELRYKSLRVRCTREINIRVVIAESRKFSTSKIHNIFSVVEKMECCGVEKMTRLLIIK